MFRLALSVVLRASIISEIENWSTTFRKERLLLTIQVSAVSFGVRVAEAGRVCQGFGVVHGIKSISEITLFGGDLEL
jgi:hypothetical protein